MSAPLRVLHIGNGSAFKIRAIVDSQLARGYDVHLVPIPTSAVNWPGVTVHALPPSRLPGKLKVFAGFLAIRRLVKKLRPDVVHAHNAWGPGWYGAATGHHPLFIHAYGGDLLPEQYAGRPALQRRLTSWACRSADHVVVTGRHMVQASGALGLDPARVVLLPRGVDSQHFRPGLDVTGLRAQLGIRPDARVVFSPRYQVDESLYNLDVVIDAFAALRGRHPDLVCVQMYDPSRHAGIERLRARAAAAGLGDAYLLTPAVDNARMPLYYNLADVMVSVPSSDGFPVTVLEASACARAMIVSELAYTSEWFTPGANGVVIPPRDASALEHALHALLEDAPARQRMGEAARAQVIERADYQRCMQKLDGHYRESLQANGRTRVLST
jgi:glycosyltransferase involved in cell wall biosynthesis